MSRGQYLVVPYVSPICCFLTMGSGNSKPTTHADQSNQPEAAQKVVEQPSTTRRAGDLHQLATQKLERIDHNNSTANTLSKALPVFPTSVNPTTTPDSLPVSSRVPDHPREPHTIDNRDRHNKSVQQLSNNPSEKSNRVCTYFQRGVCRYGTRCRNLHVAPETLLTKTDLTSESRPTSSKHHISSPAVERPPISDRAHESQPKISQRQLQPESAKKHGLKQQSHHGVYRPNKEFGNNNETEGSNSSASAKRLLSLHNLGSRKLGGRGDNPRFIHDSEVHTAKQVAKVAEEEETVEHIVFSSTKVNFGAGASVLHVVTGFESCRVLVKNLPANATKPQVITLFTQPGFDQRHFTVVSLHKITNGSHQEAVVIFDAIEDGKIAVAGLDGVEFESEKLKLEVTSKLGRMNASNRDANVLIVSWQAPSMTVVATYGCMQEAQEKASQLDKRHCCGRRVRVTLNKKPDKLPSTYFNPASVVIHGLPPDTTIEAIQEFSGTSSIKNLRSRPSELPVESSMNQLQEFIRSVDANKGVISFESQPTPTENGMVLARIRFGSWDQAKQVYMLLDNNPTLLFGGAKRYLSLPDPLHFSISVPFQQYKAQESMFKSIADQNEKNSGARIRLTEGQIGKYARIEVSGSDKRAVGSCKVRVEQLVMGERLKDWDRFFLSKEGESFLTSVFGATNAFVRVDRRTMVLKAFGDPEAVKNVKSMIAAQIVKLASTEFVFNLKRRSLKFFLHRGAAILKEQFGEDNVTLDVVSIPCKIMIRGGETARHALSKLIEESLAPTATTSCTMEEKCPICFDDIENPFRLRCGHAYCNSCLRHFLTTACDTKLFPLCCLGNDGSCQTLISLPTIKTFLRPAQVDHLLEVTFQDYLDRHPHEFKFCQTPDCPQIYRLEEGKGIVHCPSCFVTCCVSCHGEDHEGFSCEEWKMHRNPEEQERLLMAWAKVTGDVNKCPRCGALIEKNGGCNHMVCSLCKSHICWKCMGIFESGIYEHLERVHGGAFDY